MYFRDELGRLSIERPHGPVSNRPACLHNRPLGTKDSPKRPLLIEWRRVAMQAQLSSCNGRSRPELVREVRGRNQR